MYMYDPWVCQDCIVLLKLYIYVFFAWTNGWVYNPDIDGMRHRRAHYDVIVMAWHQKIHCCPREILPEGRMEKLNQWIMFKWLSPWQDEDFSLYIMLSRGNPYSDDMKFSFELEP